MLAALAVTALVIGSVGATVAVTHDAQSSTMPNGAPSVYVQASETAQPAALHALALPALRD